jgi:GTP pyrophosphokinase
LKRAYSIYQKMKRQKITIEQVYDLMAVRIINDSVKNCYAALGVIHNEWPCSRAYQGLHRDSRPTCISRWIPVVGPEGRHAEVQIRH